MTKTEQNSFFVSSGDLGSKLFFWLLMEAGWNSIWDW